MVINKVLKSFIKLYNITILGTMNYYRICIGNIVSRSRLLDIFGVGEIVSGVAGAGAQIGATAMTNEANKEIAKMNNETAIDIHEKDMAFNAEEAEKAREFNAEEADKNRQFNAEEAEKSRQWNSEQAVMERRKEAGLHSVMNGTSSGGSTASASGTPASSPSASAPSAPSLSTPIMQVPDIASAINASVNLAKATSEISGNKAKAEKDLAETTETIERTKFQSIVNSLTPEKIKTEIEDLKAKYHYTKADTERIRAIASKEREYLDSAIMQGYNEWVKNEVAKGHLSLEQNKFQALFYQHQQDIRTDAQRFAEDWRKRDYENSFRFGFSSSTSYNYRDFRSNGNDYGESSNFSFGGKSSVSVSERRDDTHGMTYGIEENKTLNSSHLRNTIYYQHAVEAEACLYILTHHKEDQRACQQALERIQMINTSVEAYSLVLNSVKGVRKFREQDQQNFEDQQE